MADQMVTVLDPQGNPGDVPAANVPAALAAGGKLGIHVYAPDGTPGYVAHDKLGDALKAGATYSPAAAANADQPHGLLQSLVAPIPLAAKTLYHNVADAPRDPNEQAIKGTSPDSGIMARALGQIGLGGYRTLIAPSIANAKAAVQDAQSPNLSNRLAAGSEAIGAIPILGQGVDAGKSVISQFLSGDKSGAVGSAIGNPLAAGLTSAAIGSANDAPPTNVTPEYGAARSIAKAVLPRDTEFNSYIDALQREKGNVEQYAAQNGLTTRTPLNMSIAAGKSADALGDFYRSKLLGPHADQQVPVPMQYDSVGSQAPSGSRYASLADIDKRIGDLNDIIRPARLNATQGATATDLTNLKSVLDEHDALTNLLNSKLGAANGLDPSVIAGVRQSLGARNQLADQTLAGANRTSLQEGRLDRGVSTIKTPTMGGLVLDAVNKIRGGPEAIANRVYRGAYPQLKVPANIGNPATIEELRSPGIADYLAGRR